MLRLSLQAASQVRRTAALATQARPASTSASIGKGPSSKRYAAPDGWEAMIGVEVHAQLRSREKLFSSAPLPDLQTPPNTHVAPFDAALPGSLPKISQSALKRAIRACLALGAQVQKRSTWDRKHYFYPDLTTGWQITQKYAPLALNGVVRLRADEGLIGEADEVDVLIEQVQLEQDTAKSVHYAAREDGTGAQTHVDLNRAGSGLVEIVSGPQMRTGEQAAAYVRKVQELLRKVGASDGNMDEGSFRCDVNVSVRRPGAEPGVRCEVKNINSARFVAMAIGYEIERQVKLIESGQAVEQDTRGFDDANGSTFRLRSKADAPDYRYMPDPSLPPLVFSEATIEAVRLGMPELPDEQRARLLEAYPDLPLRDLNVLMKIGVEEVPGSLTSLVDAKDADAVAYFEEVVKGREPKTVMNWIIHHLLKALNAAEVPFARTPIKAEHLGELLDLLAARSVTGNSAQALLDDLASGSAKLPAGSKPVHALLASRGALAMGSNEADALALESLLDAVVQDLTSEVEAVRKGKTKVMQRLVGEVMKRSKGRADAKLVRDGLEKRVLG